MHGLSGLFKLVISGVVVVAAANGTEVVDVVEVIGDVTVHAQAIVEDVDVEAESVIPEQLAYTEPDANAVFARRGSEAFAVTPRPAPAFGQLTLNQLIARGHVDDQQPMKAFVCHHCQIHVLC